MLRSAKRKPEFTVSDLTVDEEGWLDMKAADASSSPDLSVERRIIVSDFADKLLNRLSESDRLVLMSIDGEGLSVKEVSDMTGWSESKVKIKAFRARKKLRKEVDILLNRKSESE